MNFWFFIALLLVLAMLIVAFTLLRNLPQSNGDKRNAGDAQTQRITRNVRLYQQRLAHLQEDLTKEFISAEEYEGLCNELSRQLLNDVEKLENSPAQTQGRKKWLWLLLPTPLLALVIYYFIGAYPDWIITQQLTTLEHSQSQTEFDKNLATVEASIEQRLQQRPENIDYRLLLARSAMGRQDYAKATLHYGIVAELLPEDADALAFYAQAEYLRAGRKVNDIVTTAMDKALQINPHQTTVLGLKGVSAFEQGDLPAAIKSWQTLLAVIGTDSQQGQIIQEGINEAKKRLGLADVDQNPVDGVAVDDQVVNEEGISVSVSVDASIKDLNPDLPVFVYAKAVNGPPMPLAVKKLQLKDLPVEVKLTDAMAMMPQMSLSQYDSVVIGARISFSGQPIPKKGDWQAESEALLWKEVKKTAIVINKQVD